MVVDRNIVVKREGNRLLLPTINRKEVDAPANMPIKAFLMCRIIAYDPDSGTLDLKLLPDFVTDWAFRIAIEENSELLSSLYIENIVFIKFIRQPLISYFPLGNKEELERAAEKYQEIISERELKESYMKEEKAREKQTASLSLQLAVKNLKFSDGKVSFEHFVTQIARKVTFEIPNSFIKKEHDSIKNYFPKVLNINKFSVLIEFEYLEGEILSYTSSSLEISKIDETLFELVEDLYIEEYIVNRFDDEILNLNEIVVDSAKKLGTDKIQDPQWLLNKLITKERTKHFYNLRYLSDKHQAGLFNLKLTGNPLSFIFLLPVKNGYCLIWETYSTEEATYIWKLNSKVDSQLETHFQELVERIKWLRDNNKTVYLKTKPENFIKIEHNYSGEDLGFKKWKAKLENFFLNDNG